MTKEYINLPQTINSTDRLNAATYLDIIQHIKLREILGDITHDKIDATYVSDTATDINYYSAGDTVGTFRITFTSATNWVIDRTYPAYIILEQGCRDKVLLESGCNLLLE